MNAVVRDFHQRSTWHLGSARWNSLTPASLTLVPLRSSRSNCFPRLQVHGFHFGSQPPVDSCRDRRQELVPSLRRGNHVRHAVSAYVFIPPSDHL
jgi:hypothetical protein